MDDPPQHPDAPHPREPLPPLPPLPPNDPSRRAELIAIRQAILEERQRIIAGRIEEFERLLRFRDE